MTTENIDILQASNLQIQSHQLAIDISLSGVRGSLIAIVGRSGSGKTSLFRALMGSLVYQLSTPEAERPMRSWSYIPQRGGLLTWLTVEENAKFFVGNMARFRSDLEELEVDNLIHRKTSTLSGGQFQRVMMAIGANISTDGLIIDEPLTAVDIRIKERSIQWLTTVSNRFKISLIASHDIEILARLPESIYFLRDKKLVKGDVTSNHRSVSEFSNYIASNI